MCIGAGDMNMRILMVFFLLCLLLPAVNTQADSIPVANHSFEIIEINPIVNPFGAVPLISQWTELDIDENSQSTGVFRNTPAGNDNHITNVDGQQAAFLGSFEGNSISQYVRSKYQVGKDYRLTVSVCVSDDTPPATGNPLILEFLYWNVFEPVSITTVQVPLTGLTSTYLEDFTLNLSTVQADDAWADENIGISIRATGIEGGFWDLDNVRVMEFPGTPDFTGDSVVNLPDFAKMAADWLSCSQVTTDVTGDGCVNGADLQILAEYWLDDV
jgi:hypothetical protein